MSYLVLARKYRPQTFSEVIGQDHITSIFKKSLSSDRLGHAFLFCGPRGVGKTSCARILAKSLNCEKGPTLNPCGTCFVCKEIANSNSFDVIEIDGASNRGIDEIRTLRENVKFAPSYGRFKVYIVDEVHMLTPEAFNALLKTLEEPPEHVKFIFATTEPHKVPTTIISRCQRFDFKRIGLSVITENLKELCAKEKFKVDADALYAIAKAAQGSMRDALSILDQLGAIAEESINATDVYSMLGMVEAELLFEIVDALGQRDCAAALKALDNIIDQGKDIKTLTRDLTEHFRHLMVIKIGGKKMGKLVDYPIAIKEMLLTQSGLFELTHILKAIELFIEAQETARITESLRMPLEVAFAKIIVHTGGGRSTVAAKPAGNAVQQQKTKPAGTPLSRLKDEKGHIDIEGRPQHSPQPVSIKEDEEQLVAGPLTLEHIQSVWDALTFNVSRKRMSVATYLQEGVPYSFKNGKLTVAFQPEHLFNKENLSQKENIKLIEQIFSEKLQEPLTLEFKVVEDYKPRDDDPGVKAAIDMFRGKVVKQWHKEK